jgi:hypothetical protein
MCSVERRRYIGIETKVLKCIKALSERERVILLVSSNETQKQSTPSASIYPYALRTHTPQATYPIHVTAPFSNHTPLASGELGQPDQMQGCLSGSLLPHKVWRGAFSLNFRWIWRAEGKRLVRRTRSPDCWSRCGEDTTLR